MLTSMTLTLVRRQQHELAVSRERGPAWSANATQLPDKQARTHASRNLFVSGQQKNE